jgi:hypothetical protein
MHIFSTWYILVILTKILYTFVISPVLAIFLIYLIFSLDHHNNI